MSDLRRNAGTNLTTIAIALIPVAVAINYVGKLVARVAQLPLFLDSIGTVVAAILAGPIVGAIAGAVNNIFFGITADPVSFWYALTSVGIGITAGLLARAGWFASLGRAFLAGLVIALVAAIISTPLNVGLFEGQSGVAFGDAIYGYLLDNGSGLWIASFAYTLMHELRRVDLADKVVATLLAFGIVQALPKRFSGLYGTRRETVRLEDA